MSQILIKSLKNHPVFYCILFYCFPLSGLCCINYISKFTHIVLYRNLSVPLIWLFSVDFHFFWNWECGWFNNLLIQKRPLFNMMGPAGNNFLDHITNVINGKMWRLWQMEHTIHWKTFLLFKIACAHPNLPVTWESEDFCLWILKKTYHLTLCYWWFFLKIYAHTRPLYSKYWKKLVVLLILWLHLV